MESHNTVKDHQRKIHLFQSRCITVGLIVGAITLLLVARLAYLQVFKHKFYSTLSKHNIMTIIPIEPKRGLIYDRHGELLAKNTPVYSLVLIPGHVRHYKPMVEQLRKFIALSPADVKAFHRGLRDHRRYETVPIKYKLTEREAAEFYVNQYRFPGIFIQPRLMRTYPLNETLSNVVGYVGRISSKDLKHIDKINYSATDYIGKRGIEKQYEKTLHGSVGAEQAEINAEGRIVRILHRTPPSPGKNLYLTIDSKLQNYAYKLLGKNTGAVVAIQPSTGEVLAMVTKPSFNPNLFVGGISSKDYRALLNAPDHPLYDRTTLGTYAPGSTIKPFIALAGLDTHTIEPSFGFRDKGYFRLANTNHIFHDWKKHGHGWVNLAKAIMVSCDTYFYKLAVRLGIRKMVHTLTQFNFGKATGIDLPIENKGIVPTPTWKFVTKNIPWYTGDTIITGIGQGALLVTPLQLATATAMLAMHGERAQPHLLRDTPVNSVKSVTLHDSKNWRRIINAMQGVVRNRIGTASHFGRNPPYTVAAKTGTAQLYGKRNEDNDNNENERHLPRQLRNNHLFISFAPVKNPQIAIAVIIEHAANADHITRKLIDFYFKEQKHYAHAHNTVRQ